MKERKTGGEERERKKRNSGSIKNMARAEK
jgi:hypothetical protein